VTVGLHYYFEAFVRIVAERCIAFRRIVERQPVTDYERRINLFFLDQLLYISLPIVPMLFVRLSAHAAKAARFRCRESTVVSSTSFLSRQPSPKV
jgi:hypothetical protein